MSSNISPSPDSSPLAVPPTSTNSTTNSPPPTSSKLNQTTNHPGPSTPSDSSAPPPESPPPAPSAVPPPSTPLSPPPPTPPSAPPPSTPPSPPAAPPPATTVSPPTPVVSPPPPVGTPTPPLEAVSPSPPPPAIVSSPPSSNSPPPPKSKAPRNSPPAPSVTAPSPSSQSSSPPPTTNSPPPPPPTSTLLSPPPPVNSTTTLPSPVTSPPAPPSNSSASVSPVILPSTLNTTEKPTARSTNGTNVSANTKSSSLGSISSGGVAAIGIVVGFVVLSLIVMVVWFTQKRQRRRTKPDFEYNAPSLLASSPNSDSLFLRPYSVASLGGSPSSSGFMYSRSESGGLNQSRSWFTYDELARATNGFSVQNLLGEGGFGCVYKGVLVDGREVAVKQLKIGGSQGEREFRAEVEIISRIHHRYLVSLVGYCISEYQRLLVYDYVPNDTLHYHLHGERRLVMDWATRVKVAAGAARGLAYLHEDCHPRIIHRDIKSSNILLDNNFEARVSDFGLAKLAQELDSNTHVTTRVMGTFGYMAPEYATSGKLTEKSDVYSFGVVLLELITGRKPVDPSQPLGDESLVEWARPLLTEAIENEDFEALADPKLEKNYVASEMSRMIETAAVCVRHLAAKRPRMSQVARALGSLNEYSDLSNGLTPGQSEIFDLREQSAQIRFFQRLAFGSQDYSSDFFDHSQSSWRSHEHQDRSSFVP